MRPHRWHRIVRRIAIVLGTLTLWTLATAPTGFGITQLAMFFTPGMVLGIGTHWAAHAFTQEEWNWSGAMEAAVWGGIVLPPFIGFLLAWAGTFDHSALVAAFTVGSWLALIAGFVAGAARRLIHRRRPSAAHITALRLR